MIDQSKNLWADGGYTMRKTGRPLSFDREAAMESAMQVFWRDGYEGASLSTLTAAMGIASQSLYNAFGGKEKLFVEALDRYVKRSQVSADAAFAEAVTAKEAMQRHLESAATSLVGAGHPPGCMLTLAASQCETVPEQVRTALLNYRSEHEVRIRRRLARGIAEGDLPHDTDTAAAASFYATVLQGMSTQARYGATRKKLQSIASSAMRAWPAG